jgi:anthraniloyl-CoA monooxygenase
MKINIIGGGPSGLYFAILMKRLHRANEVTILERDAPDDTFGWGIVFSDQTFSYLQENDPVSFKKITGACQRWDNVDVIHRDQKVTIRGNNFSGISRLAFLNILHKRCLDLGVEIRFNTNVTDINEFAECDLLVGADGANSLVRQTYRNAFKPTVELGKNKYIWLGTRHLFHGLTLIFRRHEAGLFIAHAYKFDESTSTFIVECSEATWRNARFDWKTDPETLQYLAEVFASDLNGRRLLGNDFVRWLNFPLVKNERWHHKNVVLLGDAAHTAHFSIGSGTKLALEDAIALAKSFKGKTDVGAALEEFQRARKPVVDEYQDAAHSSLLFFENAEEEMHLEPVPFAYKLMTRSKKIDHAKLKQRDPEFIAAYDRWARSQKAEGRKKKAGNPEGRRQKAEGGRQNSPVRRAENRRQKSSVRSRKG